MPNIVLITVDSLRADHLSAYGYERETSPVIDQMAEDGLFFDAYANSHWTRASFPSIITSTYPLEYGGFEYLSDNRLTVGEAMQDLGHKTAAFHSNLWLSREYNYDRGFDHFYDSKTDPTLLSKLRTYVKLQLNSEGLLYKGLQWLYDTTEEKAGMDIGQTYRDAETITDRAIEWLTKQEGGDLFCWVHYMDVHHPYLPHDAESEKMGLDITMSDREAVKLRRKMLEEPDDLTEEEVQVLVDLYDNEIRYTDRHIGRLRSAVEEHLGLDNTAFIITGDHGEEFGEHGGFSHNPSYYDEVLHVPFVINGADRVSGMTAKGKQSEDLELLDIAPTVRDLGGGENIEAYRGRSGLSTIDTGESCDLFSETKKGEDYKICFRSNGWKFIWDRDTGVKELYNLESDTGETEDIFAEHAEVADEYESAIRDHIEEIRQTNEELPNVEMDTGTEERLKDLGYLE